MNIRDIIRRFRQGLPHEEKVPEQVVHGFLQVLEDVRREDVPCSEVYSRLDEYVERQVRGEDAARLMPLLREHFDLCRDCCDEYEALLEVLEKNQMTK